MESGLQWCSSIVILYSIFRLRTQAGCLRQWPYIPMSPSALLFSQHDS